MMMVGRGTPSLCWLRSPPKFSPSSTPVNWLNPKYLTLSSGHYNYETFLRCWKRSWRLLLEMRGMKSSSQELHYNDNKRGNIFIISRLFHDTDIRYYNQLYANCCCQKSILCTMQCTISHNISHTLLAENSFGTK